MTQLPPGQRAIEGFPRFGVDLDRPPPAVPDEISVEITGALTGPLALTRETLSPVSTSTLSADFHCVAGWSATDLTWQGWRFAEVFERVIRPALADDANVRYLVFVGADGFRSIVRADDALRDDVLLAHHLDGEPLSPDHGAPLRLVSPSQYGYVNTKHLTRIELYAYRPVAYFHPSRALQRALLAVHPHPRARVAEEERHRFFPSWPTRQLYRLVRLPAPRR